jgi:hypothetical protein
VRGGGVPEPVRDCTVAELEALLAKVKFADAVPEACGANVTWNETLVPRRDRDGRHPRGSVGVGFHGGGAGTERLQILQALAILRSDAYGFGMIPVA